MKNIIVFTDGSCIRIKNKCYTGIGIHFPNQELSDVSKKFSIEPLTNQRAELYAIYKAIKMIIKNIKYDKISVYTDSMYSIRCITEWIDHWIENDWMTSNHQPVKNQDILKKIYKMTKQLIKKEKIEFFHVKAHTGNIDYYSIHNEITDVLATNGSKKLNK